MEKEELSFALEANIVLDVKVSNSESIENEFVQHILMEKEYENSTIIENRTINNYIYRFVKRVVDITLSFILLILFSPLFVVLSLMIKLESLGPVIHRRKCIGKNGEYIMLKFRSMLADADDLEKYMTQEQIEIFKREVKLDNDPRITRIGKFIRRTSIDELPQLFNVLKGEMSLVGPRPVTQEDMAAYGKDLNRVLSVKPGMTGYWQTHGRNSVTYESGERQKLELYYVDNCSLWLDLKILIDTVGVVLKREGVL